MFEGDRKDINIFLYVEERAPRDTSIPGERGVSERADPEEGQATTCAVSALDEEGLPAAGWGLSREE